MLCALTLAQFRSWSRLTLDLDARPVVLIGPNGAGKTNLIEAISLLSPGRGLRAAQAAELPRAGGTQWRLRARLDLGEEITLTGAAQGGRRVGIDGKAASQTALGALTPVLWLTPAMDRLWTEGPEGRRRFLDRAALSFFPGHAAAALAYERAMRERNRLLKDGSEDAGWLSALEARMAEAAAPLALGRAAAVLRLNAAQNHTKSLFPKGEIASVGEMETQLSQAAAEWRGDSAELPANVLKIKDNFRVKLARGRRGDQAAGRTLTGPHRSDMTTIFTAKGVEARLCSTGEQKALLTGLVLANARALSRPPLLLLDEAVAHLDAGRRAALFDEICGLKAQPFLTGAGPELFAEFGARARRLAVEEGADGSRLSAA